MGEANVRTKGLVSAVFHIVVRYRASGHFPCMPLGDS